MSPAIEARGLGKLYGAVTAVGDVSFAVAPGQTLGLLGGNGAGKTTTLSMLLGLVTPSAGQALVLGHDMAHDRYKALPFMNLSSPYVDLPARLTVWENLRVVADLYGLHDAPARITALLDQLDLTALKDRDCGKLSAGQKTRVSLAKALINKPRVLLLDEPTASLDPDTGDWVRTMLEDYRREEGCAILLASHNMAEVERLCHDVIIMKDGRVHAQGGPKDLLARYGRQTLEEVFLDVARGTGKDKGADSHDNP